MRHGEKPRSKNDHLPRFEAGHANAKRRHGDIDSVMFTARLLGSTVPLNVLDYPAHLTDGRAMLLQRAGPSFRPTQNLRRGMPTLILSERTMNKHSFPSA